MFEKFIGLLGLVIIAGAVVRAVQPKTETANVVKNLGGAWSGIERAAYGS